MLGELAIFFEEVRRAYEEFDAAIVAAGHEPIGPRIFPPPAFDEAARRRQAEALRATEVAQPAIGAASVGLLRLLSSFGLEPDMAAGHSYGELVALHAARGAGYPGPGRAVPVPRPALEDAGGEQPGAMAALDDGTGERRS